MQYAIAYHHFRVHGTAIFETALGRIWGSSNVIRQLTVSDSLQLLDRELLEVVDDGDSKLEVSTIKSDELAHWISTGRSIFI